MKLFRDFFKGFKPKYRISYDRDLGLKTRALSSPQEGEVLLYETYFRRMRQTGETNLNLDVVNLLAYPPSKKLHSQLLKYPQEVIPAMDQVVKDLMLEVAEQDQQDGLEGMQGVEGDEEVNEIMSKIYKVRPFGLLSANMRTLNPSGKPPSCPKYFPLLTQRRHRQAGMHQRPSHSRDTSHSGHESCLFPVPHLLAYCAGRDRPRQNRRARALSPRRLCFCRYDVPCAQPL
jgi:hypothetical protein